LATKVKQKPIAPPPKIEIKQELVPVAVPAPTPALAPWLTLETCLYALILLVGLSLRLWNLAHYPLSDVEAQQALAAFQLYRGAALEANPAYSPLLVSLGSFIFLLLNDSEATARLVSVLLGTLLIILPLSLRRQLGPAVCLFTAALLALSPTAVFLSRTLNGEIGAAAGALMMIAGLFNWTETTQQRWLYLAAAGLALLLTASPMAYSVLLVLLLTVLLRLPIFKALWTQTLNQTVAANPADQQTGQQVERKGLPLQWRQAGLFLLGALVLLSTAATFNLNGFSLTTSLLTDWLSRFSFQPRFDAGFNAVFLLTIYEIVLVVAGLVGLTFVLLREHASQWLLAGWFIGSLILDLAMAGRPTSNVILSLVPLAFLAAIALAELWEDLLAWGSWSNEGIILASGLIIAALSYILLTGWLIHICAPEETFCSYRWLLSVAVMALFFVIALFFGLVYTVGTAIRGIALTGIVLGSLVMFNISSRLNYGPLMNLPYQPLAGVPVSTQLVALTDTLTREALVRAGDQTLLDVTMLVATPALQWQLRNFKNLSQVSSLAETAPTSAIITPPTFDQGLDLGEAYLGQDFALNAVWSPVGLPPQDLINWFIYRKTSQLPQAGDTVILWLRLDQK
jgi:hypothetical protein